MGKTLYEYPQEVLRLLEVAVAGLLVEKSQILICVVGETGSGKSQFGRYLRKRGFGVISPKKLAVLDDGVASVPFLWFFKRRIRVSSSSIMPEILEQLGSTFSSRPVMIYVTCNPINRFTEADIVIKVKVDDDTRLKRLIERNGAESGHKRFNKCGKAFEIDSFPHTHYFEIQT